MEDAWPAPDAQVQTPRPQRSVPPAGGTEAGTRGLFGRDALYVVLLAVQMVLTALLTPITTRLLGPTGFGQATTGIAVMQLGAALLELGLVTGVQRIYRADDGGAGSRELLTCGLIGAAVLGAVVYLTGHWWAPVLGLGAFPAPIRYGVLWAAMTAITMPALALLRSRERLLWYAMATVTMSVASEVLALGLVVVVHRTASVYMFGQFIGQAAAAAIALVAARPNLRRVRLRTLKPTLWFSLSLVPVAIASFMSNSADRIVVRGDLGPVAVARYGVAVNIGGFAIIIVGMLQFTWLPRLFAIEDREERRELLGAARDALCRLIAAGGLAIASASSVILWLWVPQSFSPGRLVLVTAIVTATAVPAAESSIYVQTLILNDRPRAVAVGSALAALLNLGLNLLVVPHWGLDGSAVVSLGSMMFYALYLRRAAGSAGPAFGSATMAVSGLGVALCIATAALPPYGVWLVPRLLITAASGIACVVWLLRLLRPRP